MLPFTQAGPARIAQQEALNRGLESFSHRFPGYSLKMVGSYTGVYDCTPDVQPVIGEVGGYPGLYVAAGFTGHGFKLAPAIGELMADLIEKGDSDLIDPELFALSRFATGQTIVSAHAYSVPTLG